MLNRVLLSERVRRLLPLLALANLVGIAIAVIAPFHAPVNGIDRVAGGGLRFGEYGTIFSEGPFLAPSESSPVTIEFLMQCRLMDDSNTFLAFYDSARGISVSFHQRAYDFAIQRWNTGDAIEPASRKEMLVANVFRPDRAVLVAAASDGQSTDVYVDGMLAGSNRNFGFARADLAGRRAVFDAPRSTSSWGGVFRAFAVLETRADAAAVRRHWETWPRLLPEDRPAALFVFDEPSGSRLRNTYSGASDLVIPHRYTVLDQVRLGIPAGIHWKDVVVNIIGFVSIGFLISALLTAYGVSRPALVALTLNFVLTLVVETIQSLLPTRDSSLADVISNTIGAAAGIWLYRSISSATSSVATVPPRSSSRRGSSN